MIDIQQKPLYRWTGIKNKKLSQSKKYNKLRKLDNTYDSEKLNTTFIGEIEK